jgi:hypothetical protein
MYSFNGVNDYCAEAELMILKEDHEFINLRMGKGK